MPIKKYPYRRTEIVPDLVCQCELRHLWRYPCVVVDEGNDAGVQRSLGRVMDAVDVLSVTFVSLANAAGCT